MSAALTRRALLLAVTLFTALPAFAVNAADAVEVIDHDWVDASRDRAVPVRLYWPAAAGVKARKVPLVVFSHGLGGSRLGYSYLGQHLARNGIASLHLQHVGSDRSLWAGASFTTLFRLRAAAHDDEAIARVHDVRFALDRLLAGEHGGRSDSRTPVPLPPGVEAYAIAGVAAEHESGLPARLVGDGLVPLASALGQHRQPAFQLAFDEAHR